MVGQLCLLPTDDTSPDYPELVEEVCQNLNRTERRRWLLAIRGKRTVPEIAELEGITHHGIMASFNRIARKNPYAHIWLRDTKSIRKSRHDRSRP